MKKLSVFIVMLVLLYCNEATGQWAYNGTHIYNMNSGNVGIGTGTIWLPTEKLHINNGSGIAGVMTQSSYTGSSQRSVGYYRIKNTASGDMFNLVLRWRDGRSEMLQSCYDATTMTWREYTYFDFLNAKWEMRSGIGNAEFMNSGHILFNNTGGIGVDTPAPANSALVDLNSTTKGFLTPRMTSSQRTGIASPATGLLVYQTDAPAGFWYFDGSVWIQLGLDQPVNLTGQYGISVTGTYPNFTISGKATYRWATFTTYDQNYGWACSNDASLFGGVTPSNWTDANGQASMMSSDKEVLRTLFTQKGYAKNNATIMNENWMSYSSTNGKVVMALFRVKNTTGSIINWIPYFYFSAYESWSEHASVALNGVSMMNTGTYSNTSLTLPIPENRVSTVIFVSTSGQPGGTGMRNCRLIFYNNSLSLPPGLEFIDDLDTATGDWSQ